MPTRTAEDTPGWDPFFGFGRVNAHRSMLRIDGPWIALDRAHYVCGGDLAIDVKDETAGPVAEVTVTGSTCGDVETVGTLPVTTGGYHRGTIPLVRAGPGCSVAPGDGLLGVVHGETLTAERGGLTATAFLDCSKNVCLVDPPLPPWHRSRLGGSGAGAV